MYPQSCKPLIADPCTAGLGEAWDRPGHLGSVYLGCRGIKSESFLLQTKAATLHSQVGRWAPQPSCLPHQVSLWNPGFTPSLHPPNNWAPSPAGSWEVLSPAACRRARQQIGGIRASGIRDEAGRSEGSPDPPSRSRIPELAEGLSLGRRLLLPLPISLHSRRSRTWSLWGMPPASSAPEPGPMGSHHEFLVCLESQSHRVGQIRPVTTRCLQEALKFHLAQTVNWGFSPGSGMGVGHKLLNG